MRKHKTKIITGLIIAIVLAFVFWYGGDAPGLRGWSPHPKEDVTTIQNDEPTKEEFAEAEKVVSDIPVQEENAPAIKENKPQSADGGALTSAEKVVSAERIAEESSSSHIESGDKQYSVQNGMVINESTGKDKYLTDPVPEGKPLPIEPENAVVTDKELTCTLSVRCDRMWSKNFICRLFEK